VSCALGNLHLAEDSVAFEYETVGDGLVSPLVTCFRRETQIMARYRMNDLLRLAPASCPCGSPLQHVQEVVGRMDDAFEVDEHLITPDVLRDAIVQADPRVHDFRLTQTGPQNIDLRLPFDCPEGVVSAVENSLHSMLRARGLAVNISTTRSAMPLDPSVKLRRIHNAWVPTQTNKTT
jgi:phenylacetate-CoA ligase